MAGQKFLELLIVVRFHARQLYKLIKNNMEIGPNLEATIVVVAGLICIVLVAKYL